MIWIIHLKLMALMRKTNESRVTKPFFILPLRLVGKSISRIFRNAVSCPVNASISTKQNWQPTISFLFAQIFSTTPFKKYQFHLWDDRNWYVSSECYMGSARISTRLLQCIIEFAFGWRYCVAKCFGCMSFKCVQLIQSETNFNFPIFSSLLRLDEEYGLLWQS